MDCEANALNISEARKMRQDMYDWKEKSLEVVDRFEEEQTSTQFRAITSWFKMDESDQLTIFETISAEAQKHSGTCSWLLRNNKLSSWLQPKPEWPFIWLQGTAGSGKSVISTEMVKFLQTSRSFVIHHFCTYSYASSTAYDRILKSLALQLIRKDPCLVAHVYAEFVIGMKSPTSPSIEKLLQLLSKTISDNPNQTHCVWIVLDGLNECETEVQTRLLSLMNQIVAQTSSLGNGICKVLVSSRGSPTLTRCMRKRPRISLSEEKDCLEQAIRHYASQRLRSFEEKLHQLHMGGTDVDEIEREIARKADGRQSQHSHIWTK
jgi:hypothetical protein